MKLDSLHFRTRNTNLDQINTGEQRRRNGGRRSPPGRGVSQNLREESLSGRRNGGPWTILLTAQRPGKWGLITACTIQSCSGVDEWVRWRGGRKSLNGVVLQEKKKRALVDVEYRQLLGALLQRGAKKGLGYRKGKRLRDFGWFACMFRVLFTFFFFFTFFFAFHS